MEAIQEATQEAIQEAKKKTSQATTWRAAQLNGTEIIFTFGTLSFSINHQEACSQTLQSQSAKSHRQSGNPQTITPLNNTVTGKNLSTEHPFPAISLTKQNHRGNHGDKHQGKHSPINRYNTTPRYIKVPQATKEWQQVTRKPKRNKKNSIECYYCHKKGHVQKFCWQRIECLNCGKRGHKFSKCYFKAPKNPPGPRHNSLKSIDKEHQQTPKQPSSLTMEPIHGRPTLGDIFSPSRQNLNQDNNYLNSVGLIILIRGSPSPDLPRLVAEKLVQTHGGHPNDFIVTQATISPYLVTCSNSQLRDAVVQRGIYSIPRAQVQFTIHEWRPRFGMGYDPPTHQVWVKVIGLPLQAWTTPELIGILQNFGHPMQILPFGRAAGHFRDITALVATKNPIRIPLAYTYREGDYATKIDIIILSWRPWEESYFPPPEDNNFPQHTRPYNHAGPSNPHHRSPSSSASSAAPSEPTIDLSAWSPRSHQAMPLKPHSNISPTSQIHPTNQIILSKKSQKEKPPHPMATQAHPMASYNLLKSPTNGKIHTSVTADPSLPKIPLQLFTLLHACLQNVPNPIAINPLHILWTINSTTLSLGEARGRSVKDFCSTTSLLQYLFKISKFTGSFSELSHSYNSITLPPKCTGPTCGPSPITLDQALINSGPFSIDLGPLHTPEPTHQQSLDLASIQNQSQSQPSLRYENPLLTFHSPAQQMMLSDSNPNGMLIIPHTPISPLTTMTLPDQNTDTQLPISPTEIPNLLRPPQRKQRTMPVRRSQRIQEKRTATCSERKQHKKSKTQTCKIPFVNDSHLIPLDASKTLQILQATGLTINKQIEDLIEEAEKQDQLMEVADQSAPTTLLHDPIPPLVVPGIDMLL